MFALRFRLPAGDGAAAVRGYREPGLHGAAFGQLDVHMCFPGGDLDHGRRRDASAPEKYRTALQSAELSAEFGDIRTEARKSQLLGPETGPPAPAAGLPDHRRCARPPSGAACPAQCRQTPSFSAFPRCRAAKRSCVDRPAARAGIVGRSRSVLSATRTSPEPRLRPWPRVQRRSPQRQEIGLERGVTRTSPRCCLPLLAHPSLRPQSRRISAMDWPSIDDREPPSALCAS